jgi:hypothetical protein
LVLAGVVAIQASAAVPNPPASWRTAAANVTCYLSLEGFAYLCCSYVSFPGL